MMQKLIVWAAVCLAVTTSSTVLAQDVVYRWLDQKGEVHYTDTPPPKDAREVTMRKTAATSTAKELPYLVRQAAANFPVTLYVADGCGPLCTQAKELLNFRGIPFTEKVIASQEDLDEMKKTFNGSAQVPSALVGERQLSGFDASSWNSLLDNAGYPK